ncbi:MAG: hypothetical protein K2P58_07085 [Hyphomonadaceae bacterium]|nr:hypothetical protein [Hyphomonadaceae bacterium]
MRILVVAAVAALWISAAAAQEAVEIPFAPTQGVYVVEETRTRTFTENGQTRTSSGQVRSTLELRARGASFDAIWTTLSANPSAIVIDNGGADPTLLIGEAISLKLDESGAPNGMSDWGGVRRRMFQIMLRHERDPFWRRAYEATERVMASWGPETAAPALFFTLGIMSACHNTGLAMGEPLVVDVPIPNALGGPPITTRTTWELQAVDRQAGTVRILHTRSPDLASANASAAQSVEGLEILPGDRGQQIGSAGHRTECVVDLQSGMVRSLTFEVRMSLGSDAEVRRRVITVRSQ